ncbi:Sodium/calcium exchanger protein-domain-containing protein [Kickxella alabastrina]|uniref:Sodium/calcium exchanger protein-domain-containing protein n=1 Tax=Kickxella alabastrina TaxID=61397 RepID=UPI00221E46A1|nr:Sodium/calcium exchanger protein-domain-containing protein [Kickxella alabastrina]KAI7833786.1 Sodium/calcium exchanger protein-domain-containing protein [Kickxella alabastrina]
MARDCRVCAQLFCYHPTISAHGVHDRGGLDTLWPNLGWRDERYIWKYRRADHRRHRAHQGGVPYSSGRADWQRAVQYAAAVCVIGPAVPCGGCSMCWCIAGAERPEYDNTCCLPQYARIGWQNTNGILLKTHSEIFDGTHMDANSDIRNQCPYHSEKHETVQMEFDMIDSKPSLGLNTHPVDTKIPSKNNSIRKDSGAVIDAKFIKETRECHLRHSAPLMIMWVAILLLIVVFGLVVLSSDILVDSVEELTTHYNISHTFVGMILLPIASNAAEHTMSVTVALRNKMDLCITVAVGSSMQMTLFVLPLLIIIAWFLSRPLTLFFDDFETTTMLISVLVFNYLIMNGRSNWLKGAMLLCSYSIVALAFFLYPNELDNVRGNVAANFVSSTSLPISAAKLTEPTLSSSKLSFL